ncbi:MAG: hypothetical protein IJ944_02375 [Clostridia bacterium]|nr:hypothetical protein [Clostridia bacterium]
MRQFEVTFMLNGHMVKEIVAANGAYYARQIIEARYKGNRLNIIGAIEKR